MEIAQAHADSMAFQPTATAPQEGVIWRINFSRVERKGEVNWTWSPQTVWDCDIGRDVGVINMHLPDCWGFLQFVSKRAAGVECDEKAR